MPFDSDPVECNLVADVLECSSTYSQGRLSIPVDDVVCVVPRSVESTGGYSILYLKEQTGQEPQLESVAVKSIPSALSTCLIRDTPGRLQIANIHIVISTLSGTGGAKSTFRRALQPLLSHLGLESNYNLHETQSPDTIADLARSSFLPAARAGISQTIILLSGDGGLVDIVNVFYSYGSGSDASNFVPPEIVLIPTGTGNAMANSAGLLDRPKSALVSLVRGTPRPIPAFVASFSPGARLVVDGGKGRAPLDATEAAGARHRTVYGAVVASWGIHAALVADSDAAEYRRFGVDRFKMAANELLYPSDATETHRFKGAVSLFKCNGQSGFEIETIPLEEHMYVLATFVSNLEKGFTISPASAPLDGRLRMVHFGPVSPEETMRLLGLAYQGGQHVHEPGVTYEEIEGFRVVFNEESEKWRRVCVDGKIIAVEEGGLMEVHKDTRHLLDLVS